MCNVNELLQSPTVYQEHAVRGIEERITGVGQTVFLKLTQNAVPLTDEMVDDTYGEYLVKCGHLQFL